MKKRLIASLISLACCICFFPLHSLAQGTLSVGQSIHTSDGSVRFYAIDRQHAAHLHPNGSSVGGYLPIHTTRGVTLDDQK